MEMKVISCEFCIVNQIARFEETEVPGEKEGRGGLDEGRAGQGRAQIGLIRDESTQPEELRVFVARVDFGVGDRG